VPSADSISSSSRAVTVPPLSGKLRVTVVKSSVTAVVAPWSVPSKDFVAPGTKGA
jgi:hypothetical protein